MAELSSHGAAPGVPDGERANRRDDYFVLKRHRSAASPFNADELRELRELTDAAW